MIVQPLQRDALLLPHLFLRDRNRRTSRQCHQFIEGWCRLHAKGGIAVTIIIVKRSRLIHCKFNVCVI